MPEPTFTDPRPVHDDVRYETSDARPGPLFLFGAGVIVAGLVIHGGLLLLFESFRKSMRDADQALPSLAAREHLQLPRDIGKIPAPVLQRSETNDLILMRQAEEEHLASYGWVDAKAGIVHIPVSEAMKLLGNARAAQSHGIRVRDDKKKGDSQ